jgi:F-type H+-transporting ATPase subunit b
MEIVPDPLLVALFLPPFLVAVLGMWFILWRPLLTWMDARDDASADAIAEARRLDAEAVAHVQTLEERLAGAQNQIIELRNTSRAEALGREKVILGEARGAAEQEVDKAVAAIAEQTEVARKGLSDAARSIADDMATQVLGRPIQA